MLKVEGLFAGYGEQDVLHEVAFRIAATEFFGLLGANNAGKSTLINCISGTMPTRRGRILFDGRDISHLDAHEIVDLGVIQVPEGRLVFPQMTVLDNLRMGGVSHRARSERARRIEEAFELFPRLRERSQQLAGTLSGGEQQMLAIGRGLVADPRLLMLDEPSLGLSPLFVQSIFRTLATFQKRGLTVLVVEQNLNLTLTYATRCAVLEQGRIVVEGRGTEVKNDPRTRRAYLGL